LTAGFSSLLGSGRLGVMILGSGSMTRGFNPKFYSPSFYQSGSLVPSVTVPAKFIPLNSDFSYPFYRIMLYDTLATGGFVCPHCHVGVDNDKIFGDPRTDMSFSLCPGCNWWLNYETNRVFSWDKGLGHRNPMSNKPGATLFNLPGGDSD
jgi:hypothetical protein